VLSDLRLVATDLDGTLLHPDGTVSARTQAALAAVEARGVAVVFVTGRPIRWMRDLWEHVGDHGIAVCSNGAVVYDVAQHAVRTALPIPTQVGRKVTRLLAEAVPGTTFAAERTTGFAKEQAFMERYALPEEVAVLPIEDLVDDATVKLLARHEQLDPQQFWAEADKAIGHLVTTTWSSVGALVEMSAAGVTKASTLARLCEELGVTREQVVAFGDMPNDLAMLEWAGTSYAMGNAHPAVLEQARHTAPTNEDDGVAATLETLFALPGGA
jgi:Cof subfamily protein (haloacid dehalogenase superfamily)